MSCLPSTPLAAFRLLDVRSRYAFVGGPCEERRCRRMPHRPFTDRPLVIRTAFLGTPRSALPSLDALADFTDLRLVVTRPDRPRGRGRTPAMPAVKARALERGIPVHQPSTPQQLDALIASRALDVVVAVAYGMIVPVETLARPRGGMVNLHFSLLPRWRGAAPVQRAILVGDATTGVTLMQMEEGLDSGGMLAVWETAIGQDETSGALTDRLAVGGAELLESKLEAAVAGELVPVPQDERLATRAPRVSAGEARLDFTTPAAGLARAIRAFCPRPGAHTIWRGNRFKIHRGRVVPGKLEPGRLEADPTGVRVGTVAGCIDLLTVQPAGARSMEALRWLRGVKGDPGRFE